MKGKIRVDAKYARLIQPFTETPGSTRYYLAGFYVEPHPVQGVFIVATDGHKMGVFHDENGRCDEPAIVQLPKQALSLLKGKTFYQRRVTVDLEKNVATVEDWIAADKKAKRKEEVMPLGTFPKVVVDGMFPDWRRVLPRIDPAKPNVSQGFGQKHLEAFTKVNEGGSWGSTMRIISQEIGAPALVLTGMPEFFGCIMPMRDRGQEGFPNWLYERPAKEHRNPDDEFPSDLAAE